MNKQQLIYAYIPIYSFISSLFTYIFRTVLALILMGLVIHAIHAKSRDRVTLLIMSSHLQKQVPDQSLLSELFRFEAIRHHL